MPAKKRKAADEEEFDDEADAISISSGEDDGDDDFNPGGGGKDDDDEDFKDLAPEDAEEDEKPKAKKQKKSKEDTGSKKAAPAKKKAAPKKKAAAASDDDNEDEEEAKPKKKAPAKKTADAGGAKKGAAAKGGKDTKDVIKSESEARKVILEYMEGQNRPYSVQNVMDNLHGRVKKAMTTKVLDKLVSDGDLTAHESGKTKVYFLNQTNQDVLSSEEMAELDQEMKDLTEEKNLLSGNVRDLMNEKERTTKALTNEEMIERIEKLRKEIETKEAKLEGLQTTKLATPEEKKAAQQDLDKFKRIWAQRKRATKDIVDLMSESMDKKPKVIFEEHGMETDEDVGVDITQMGKLAQS